MVVVMVRDRIIVATTTLPSLRLSSEHLNLIGPGVEYEATPACRQFALARVALPAPRILLSNCCFLHLGLRILLLIRHRLYFGGLLQAKLGG